MPSYLNQNGNSIGSLLRFIQEQKSQGPIVPPATDVGSPIRGVVQEPLKAPEAVGTSHQVSVKPEGPVAPGQGTPSVVPGAGPAVAGGGVVGPVTPAPSPVGPVSPGVGNAKQVEGPMQMKVTGAYATSPVSPSVSPKAPSISAPAIGASVSGPTPYRAPYGAFGPEGTPQRSSVGGSVILGPENPPIPTQTPAPGQPRQFYPTSTPTPSPKKSSAPNLGTVISLLGGGGLQGLKKLFKF